MGLAMINWFRDIWLAVTSVCKAMWVTVRYWGRTYDPKRGTFTEQYEYPELPLVVSDRYHGFHRYDMATCTACGLCAKSCPASCIYVGREKAVERKGFDVTGFTIDYTKCMFCAICTEACPKSCIKMGSAYDLSCYERDGCIVNFSHLPPEIAWGRDTLNPTVVALSKLVASPVALQREPADG